MSKRGPAVSIRGQQPLRRFTVRPAKQETTSELFPALSEPHVQKMHVLRVMDVP